MKREIPQNWILTELGEIAAWGSGGTPKRGNDLYFNGTIPWIKTGELNGNIIYDTDEKITELALKNSSAKIFPKGSIAIAMYGATIGKTGVLGIDASTNQACAIAQAYDGISNNYLHYYLISEKQNFIEKGKGGAQPNISQTVIKQHNFPLAPFNEQTRIVVKLDQLFSHLDKLKARLDSIPELLKQFRHAVLNQAVTGKLTEGWRDGKVLEAVTLTDKKSFIEYSILEYPNLHKSWMKTVFGNYAFCSRGKFTARPRNDPKFFDGSFPFMQIGDLPRNGGYTVRYSKTLNDEGVKVSKSFPKNTIAIAIVGATIGNTGILTSEMFFPDSLIGINCENEISNYFVEYCLRLMKNGLREISYAGGGQPNIKIPTIKNLEIAIPSIEEQTEIVHRVDSLFAIADKIEKQYKALKVQIDNLPRAILAKAFKGELVDQLSTDGDAQDLLNDITKLKLPNQVKNNYDTNNKKLSRAAEDEVIYKE